MKKVQIKNRKLKVSKSSSTASSKSLVLCSIKNRKPTLIIWHYLMRMWSGMKKKPELSATCSLAGTARRSIEKHSLKSFSASKHISTRCNCVAFIAAKLVLMGKCSGFGQLKSAVDNHTYQSQISGIR